MGENWMENLTEFATRIFEPDHRQLRQIHLHFSRSPRTLAFRCQCSSLVLDIHLTRHGFWVPLLCVSNHLSSHSEMPLSRPSRKNCKVCKQGVNDLRRRRLNLKRVFGLWASPIRRFWFTPSPADAQPLLTEHSWNLRAYEPERPEKPVGCQKKGSECTREAGGLLHAIYEPPRCYFLSILICSQY